MKEGAYLKDLSVDGRIGVIIELRESVDRINLA
jgi:hypothetical protein